MRWFAVLAALATQNACSFEVVLSATDGSVAIDVTLPPCPAAPGGCTAFTCAETPGSCHYYCSFPDRATNAQARCTMIATNGCLVTLDDAAEDMCVRINAGTGNLIHIGLLQASGASEPAGGWGWRCGASTYGPRWTGSEPNDSGGEDCAAMNTQGDWVDVGCTEQFRFACEVPR